MLYQNHLVIDLEATCSNDDSFPRDEMEIIEIGAVMLDANTFEALSEFQILIQPIKHPKLTDFCNELTSITQADVDSAVKFPEAIKTFKAWLQLYESFDFSSWGQFDKNQLTQDCKSHNIPLPFETLHRNLKIEFSQFLGVKKGYGMARALRRINIPLTGTHHRGLDDAKNTAKILIHMQTNKQAPSQQNP